MSEKPQHSQENTSENLIYQKAYSEWSDRIGSAKTQAKNWRLACLLSLLLLVLLVIAMIAVLNLQKSYVYVAEIKPQDSIVNVKSLDTTYSPTQAQEEYFVSRFIKNIMSLPLDPIVLRDDWISAFSFVQGTAMSQLNNFMQAQNPFALVGKQTQTVTITQYNSVSDSSYEFNWRTETYDDNGKLIGSHLYNGIFTVVQGQQPRTQQELLDNPLGMRIEYFSISNESDTNLSNTNAKN